jgi:O-methyltransferase involved in polyketide biosynthesis
VFTYVDRAVLAMIVSGSRRSAAGSKTSAGCPGEPWTFGLDPAEVEQFVARRGFGLIGDLSTAETGERYCRPLGHQERGSALYHLVTASVLAKD